MEDDDMESVGVWLETKKPKICYILTSCNDALYDLLIITVAVVDTLIMTWVFIQYHIN